jgi:hypothetical protein
MMKGRKLESLARRQGKLDRRAQVELTMRYTPNLDTLLTPSRTIARLRHGQRPYLRARGAKH